MRFATIVTRRKMDATPVSGAWLSEDISWFGLELIFRFYSFQERERNYEAERIEGKRLTIN